MIIKVTNDEKGYHANVKGAGYEIKEGLETLLEGLLRGGMPEGFLDRIVANAKNSAARDPIYTDTDSIKYESSSNEDDKINELLDDILEMLAKRRRNDE